MECSNSIKTILSMPLNSSSTLRQEDLTATYQCVPRLPTITSNLGLQPGMSELSYWQPSASCIVKNLVMDVDKILQMRGRKWPRTVWLSI